jgi:hypothetical protein
MIAKITARIPTIGKHLPTKAQPILTSTVDRGIIPLPYETLLSQMVAIAKRESNRSRTDTLKTLLSICRLIHTNATIKKHNTQVGRKGMFLA